MTNATDNIGSRVEKGPPVVYVPLEIRNFYSTDVHENTIPFET